MTKPVIEIGTEVDFKKDIEGSGVVALVKKERNWDRSFSYTYAVKSPSEPNGYPFHSMATWSEEANAMVVWVDEDHIWSE